MISDPRCTCDGQVEPTKPPWVQQAERAVHRAGRVDRRPNKQR